MSPPVAHHHGIIMLSSLVQKARPSIGYCVTASDPSHVDQTRRRLRHGNADHASLAFRRSGKQRLLSSIRCQQSGWPFLVTFDVLFPAATPFADP